MPLSFGYRDENNERINNLLRKLIALTLVSGHGNDEAIEQMLEELGLSRAALLEKDAEAIIRHLADNHLDWANMEQVADVLAELCRRTGLEPLKEKAITLYNFIQKESRLFSFEIMAKVNALS
jgi:non-ribosomal peptide synthetase component E (peptide arylation enzyme)